MGDSEDCTVFENIKLKLKVAQLYCSMQY